MRSPTGSEDSSAERNSFREIITAIVKRFARLAGLQTALRIARKVSRLTLDDDGNVLEYDTQDPLGTITLLIDQFEVLYGEVARTLVRQAAQPLAAITDNQLLREVGLSDGTSIPTRVLIVDDHVLFREALVSLLEAQPDLKVVGQADSVRDAIAFTENVLPDLVLMNITLPDGTAAEAIRAVLAERPGTKIVVLTLSEEDNQLFEAIRAGAIGYLSKHAHVAMLFKTLQGVMRGEAGISGLTARRILEEFARLSPTHSDEGAPLTSREVEVLRELANGASNQMIARQLVISENTVKNHVRNILVKLHFHSRREAANYARRHGISSNPPTNSL
jgi:two-component system, NarL family, nitrate/nitrite response regulator NarL